MFNINGLSVPLINSKLSWQHHTFGGAKRTSAKNRGLLQSSATIVSPNMNSSMRQDSKQCILFGQFMILLM